MPNIQVEGEILMVGRPINKIWKQLKAIKKSISEKLGLNK